MNVPNHVFARVTVGFADHACISLGLFALAVQIRCCLGLIRCQQPHSPVIEFHISWSVLSSVFGSDQEVVICSYTVEFF